MDKYTPTTADILECYKGQLIQTGDNTYELIDEDRAIAEFGRWIKAERNRVAKMAAEKERKRIIKRLDKYKMYRFEKEWMIELIEGYDESDQDS